MSLRDFSSAEGRSRLERAVITAESFTSAEVVIAVRRAASPHHRTTLAFAFGATLVGLLAWWFSPVAYDLRLLPIELAATFGIAAFVIRSIDPLRRVLTPRALRRTALEDEAREAFDTLGVRATSGRTGILIVAGLFEHDAAVIADEGLDYGALGAAASALERSLAEAVAAGDVEAFARAVESLGALLGRANPRADDDVNELSDAIR